MQDFEPSFTISLIVAHDEERCIGKDNRMLFHLPADLRNFKKLTMGKPVIMGRSTYESIGKPLPGRTNLVVSRTMSESPGVKVLQGLEEALHWAAAVCAAAIKDNPTADQQIFVIGGGEIYAQTIDLAQQLFITLIQRRQPGDTYFPPYDEDEWEALEERPYQDAGIPCIFRKLQRHVPAATNR